MTYVASACLQCTVFQFQSKFLTSELNSDALPATLMYRVYPNTLLQQAHWVVKGTVKLMKSHGSPVQSMHCMWGHKNASRKSTGSSFVGVQRAKAIIEALSFSITRSGSLKVHFGCTRSGSSVS